jgi:hypothetical protein
MALIFPLSIQLTHPEAYRKDEHFSQVLESLQQNGFSGIELNILRLEKVDPQELKSFLYQYDLKMTMFASGAAAKGKDMGYRGGIAIEGTIKGDLLSDIQGTMKYLEPILREGG